MGTGSVYVMNAYWIMLGLNAIPFALFAYAEAKKDEKLARWLNQNFLLSAESIDNGRWWTGITSAFSQAGFTHFAFNMYTAYTMCKIMTYVPGLHGGHVAAVMLGSAVSGSIGFVVSQRAKMARLPPGMERVHAYRTSALGASGSVMGLAAVTTCFYPTVPVNLMFIPIGIPLWVVTAAYFAIDAYRLDSQNTRTAHAGHLGGLAFGVGYYFLALKGLVPFGVWTMIRRFFQ